MYSYVFMGSNEMGAINNLIIFKFQFALNLIHLYKMDFER